MQSLIQNAIDALSFGSLYALFALGIALIFGIMGLINFAHGELIMAGGFAIVILGHPGWPLLILGTLVIVVVVALAVERVAFRPVRGADPITLLVTSFAVSYLLQNLAQVIFGTVPRSTNLSTNLASSFAIHGIFIAKLDVLTVIATVVLIAGLGLFLNRTRLGVQMRAAAEDFRMARVLGVNANRVVATAFALSGVLAGVASILLVAQTGVVTSSMGSSPVLVAFIATVLGGIGSLRGAALGGFILGVITVALQAYLPLELRYYRDAFAYSAVIVMLLARPQGLVVAKHVVTRV
ncbi:MAG TPA: branched-chain amino acid ABC transporter permease [Gaiellaceae bacterium]|nr:branched-chain amino acid ABC transporter permease [Gaiellaceae bacterium]